MAFLAYDSRQSGLQSTPDDSVNAYLSSVGGRCMGIAVTWSVDDDLAGVVFDRIKTMIPDGSVFIETEDGRKFSHNLMCDRN